MKGPDLVFGLVDLGLLAGGGATYYFLIQRPLTWPRADAVVVSSRVVNPKRPSQYQPELVFRIEGNAAREVTVVPNWSSSSHDMVRSYVDGYPAGRTVSVAINPADASDVRHELGVTLLNVIVPAVLGLMGLFFLGIAWAARPQRERHP